MRDDRSSPSQVLLLGAWLGLATGLLDAVICLLLRGVPGFVLRLSEEILWISPTFHLLLFFVTACGLLVLFGLLRRPLGLKIVISFLSGIGFGLLLLRLGKTNPYVSIFLGFAMGIQLARMFHKREKRWLSFLNHSFRWVVAMAVAAGLLGAVWADVREKVTLRGLPPAVSGAPNVLLITLDTLRADHVGAYGYARPTTPNIDRIAQQGVLFEHAMANSSWTLPAHASLFTGRLPHEHGADWRIPLDARLPTVAEAFLAKGYRTAAFAANRSYVSPEWGLGRGFARFEVYGDSFVEDAMRTVFGSRFARVVLPRIGYFDIPGRKRAADVNREFLGWLDDGQGRPFFAFLNYLDVHDPYVTVPPHRSQFSSNVTAGEWINFQFQPHAFRRKPSLSAHEIEAEINGYDGCLAYLDVKLGELFSALHDRGLDGNTLVILTSDHGEAFGNHDLFGHGNSLYMETLHIPLIFYWPGRVPSGKRIPGVVGLEQIPATVQELISLGASFEFPGPSLVPRWSGAQAEGAPSMAVVAELTQVAGGPPAYPVSNGSWKSLITDEWHSLFSDSGEVRLYSWREDPQELHDVAETEEGRQVIVDLRRRLENRTNSPVTGAGRFQP